MPEITEGAAALARLKSSRVIAVLGASPTTHRPAHYVPAYLVERGYTVIPVNPRYVGTELFGHPVLERLAEISAPVDLVNVFRKPSDLPGHLGDFLAMTPKPGLVWFQLGIVNQQVADELVLNGIDVVQNRCTLAMLRSDAASSPS